MTGNRAVANSDSQRPHPTFAVVSGSPPECPRPADDPPGAVPVQPMIIRRQEDRPFYALADGQVDCPGGARHERDGDDLAALAGDRQGPLPTLDTQGLDVGADSLEDPQAAKERT
jgi:hypothetical protein